MYRTPLEIIAAILEHLINNDGSSNVSKVCTYCKLSQTGLEKYIESLVNAGLITDVKQDERHRIFTINNKGRELLQAFKSFKNTLESYNLIISI